ncbi:TPA: hypothetical protein ACHJS7_002971, partial [Escherichia coli]
LINKLILATSKAKVSILEKRVISQNQQTVDFNFCEYFLQSVMHGLGLLIFIPFVVFYSDLLKGRRKNVLQN